MTAIWILTAQLLGGFAMIPLASEADCLAALAALPPAITWAGECTRIEVLAPASPLAPEQSPLPPPKPKSAAIALTKGDARDA